jgi:hypothetical protein
MKPRKPKYNPTIRCPSIGPPPEKYRCGLPVGHAGRHTVLMETGAPWAVSSDNRKANKTP